MALTLLDVLSRTETWFRQQGIDTPRLDAELLLCKLLGVERLQLYLLHDRPMTDQELDALREDVRRRGRREPLAWVLGTRDFHEITLHTPPGVLVPRPDTETLVEAALEWIPEDAEPVYVADVGCGTGAVGLALAVARPGVRLYAVDPSEAALEATRINVERLGLSGRVGFLRGRHLDPIPAGRPVDWVVSNPPYVPSGDLPGLEPEISRHEPRLALDGGPDGLGVIRPLVEASARRAAKGVLLEVGFEQSARVIDLMRRARMEGIRTWDDLGGVPRVVGGRTTPRRARWEAPERT